MPPVVVLLAGNAPPIACGIGDYTARLSAELRGLGVAASVWTRAQRGARGKDAIHTSAARLDRAGVEVFIARLRRERPAVLHLQYEADLFDGNGFALLRFALAAREVGASLVTTFHALDGPRAWGRAHRLALLPALIASRDIVVCSRRQYDALARLPGVRGRTRLIPVGSAIPVTGTRSVRRGGEPVRLLYFGFVWRGRNLETCVRALAGVERATPATLTIVGGFKEEGYERELAALAESLGVGDRVTFTGELPVCDVSRYLAGADLALLPFATGVSTGRTTFAAAVEHGLPVVTMATAANTIPEFRKEINLLSVAAGDADGFIRETVRAATDAALRERLRENAPPLARLFSWPNIARKTADLPSYRAL